MKVHINNSRVAAIAAGATLSLMTLPAGTANAQIQVALTPTSVIGGSGSFGPNFFNTGPFSAGFVFDNQSALVIPEPNQFAADADGGYWLGKEGDVTEFFVVDLGSVLPIISVDVYNTHNAFYNDRGTRDFQIFGSNTIAPLVSGEPGAGGFDLVAPTLLTSGTLLFQTFQDDPIEPQTFTTGSGNFRYLRFQTLNENPPGGVGGFSGVGLNELKVFSNAQPTAAPEAGTLGLLAGTMLPLAGFAIRRRCNRK
jgi:hypothetical protein